MSQKAAADPGLQTMTYDVYAGGIHAVEAQMDIDLRQQDRYDVVFTAETRGFLGSLAPWNGTFESRGWILANNDFRPELHKSTTTWRDETEVKEYQYTKDRRFDGLIITDHGKKPYKKDVDDELTQGTTDVFTAALLAMQAVAEGQNCEGTSEVFDGKRRFEMKFNHRGTKELLASKYNVYQGPAAECTVEVVPVSGAWHSKPRGWLSIQEQGRDRGTMPTVWMARMEENGPAVPVKVMVKTAYGAMFMHLTQYQNGQGVQVAENKTDD